MCKSQFIRIVEKIMLYHFGINLLDDAGSYRYEFIVYHVIFSITRNKFYCTCLCPMLFP